jgi:hypothetical protein
MPVAKIHLLEDQYSEARLDKVSNAIQETLVGHRHGGCDLHAPAVGGKPQHPLRDAEWVTPQKPRYMIRRSKFPLHKGESSEHWKGWKQWLSRANHAT